MTALTTGERRHALRDRKDDLYETPPEATRALLAVEPLPKVIWELSAEAIVTNPPFKVAAQYIERALQLAPKVCCLLRLAFLEGGALNTDAGRARRYVMDECPPARVHVFSRRLPMMHRDGWDGVKTNSATAFAWFVWERPHTAPTQLLRVDWKTAGAAA